MKKSILIVVAMAFIGATVITGCDNSAKKLEKAQNASMEADEDLVKARQDYLSDMEKFKKETDQRIAANKKSITQFEARVAKEKKETKEAYALKIAELEQKNTDLKKRLDNFKAMDQEQWDTFKMEFSKDLDELGKSFKDLSPNSNDN